MLEQITQFPFHLRLFDSLPVGVALTDAKGKITIWNKKMTFLTGKVKLNIKNKNILQNSWAQNLGISRLANNILVSEEYSTGVLHIETKDHRKKPVSLYMRISKISYEQKTLGLLLTCENVTFQENARKDLANTQEYYQSILSNLLIGILVTDQHGNIMTANPSLLKISGHTRKSHIIGKKLFKDYAKHANEEIRKGVKKVLTTGETCEFIETEYKREHKTQYLSIRIAPIKTKHGQIKGTVQTIYDATQEVELKNIIQDLNKYHEGIIESSPTGILVTDLLGMITKVNKAHEHITGKQRNETIGKILYQEYASDADSKIRKAFHEVITKGKTFTFHHYEYISSRKGKKYFDIRLGPVQSKDKEIIGMVQILEDVTKEVKLQHELQKYSENLELKIQELNSSYIEIGRVNRQLASLIDIQKVFPYHQKNLPIIKHVIESLAVITGAQYGVLHFWNEVQRAFTFHFIPARNKIISLSEEDCEMLRPYFYLAYKQKKQVDVQQISQKESENVPHLPREKNITSAVLLPIDTHNKRKCAVGLFFDKKRSFSNLDIEFIKAFMNRIETLLFVSYNIGSQHKKQKKTSLRRNPHSPKT